MELGLARNLNLYRPENYTNSHPKTPNEWFAWKFPHQLQTFGSPFIELTQTLDLHTHQVQIVSINVDFFAGCLGGRKDLGHHCIYYQPELQFYFYDLAEKLYIPTSQEKLANLYRAILIKCAEDMPQNVHKLNLFHEFRSDKISKQVVHRAKSILAASESFFSADSPHMRKQGPELPERLGRVFVESMLEKRDGSLLTLTHAYQLFCQISLQRNLAPIPRVTFKEMMRDMMKDKFGVCLRNDVPDQNNKQQKGWKGVGVSEISIEA